MLRLLLQATRGAPRRILAIEDRDELPSPALEDHRLLRGRVAAMHRAAAPASAYQAILEERCVRSQVLEARKLNSKKWMRRVCHNISNRASFSEHVYHALAQAKHQEFLKARGRHYANEAEAMKVHERYFYLCCLPFLNHRTERRATSSRSTRERRRRRRNGDGRVGHG